MHLAVRSAEETCSLSATDWYQNRHSMKIYLTCNKQKIVILLAILSSLGLPPTIQNRSQQYSLFFCGPFHEVSVWSNTRWFRGRDQYYGRL